MEYLFSGKMQRLQSPAVGGVWQPKQAAAMISFASDGPAEELYPAEAVADAAERVFAAGKDALRYGPDEGYTPLREQLCERLAAQGMKVQPAEMLLTAGLQQTIDLLVRVLTDPGAVILVENPTCLASLQVFHLNQLQVIPVESDHEGMIIEDAERLMRQHRPRLVYAAPTFGSPTGRVWSVERRRALVEMCSRHRVPILEDDRYGELTFDARYPTLLSLAGEADNSCVIYVGTFADTVAPALRTSWAVGDKRVMQMMLKAKQAAERYSGLVDQLLLDQLLRHFSLDRHIRTVAETYGRRMREMVTLLQAEQMEGVAWLEPRGGMFLWVELPEALDAAALLRCAAGKGVSFVPGEAFYAAGAQRNTARLNFACTSGERTALGVSRLAEAIGEFTARG
ncbi:PLP-dependent aminotransferase family protein [Paenibacillus sp. GCM10027626]|uniref:aminotransferase-like domain-containing protein n=1 Tax=Paenibacillus sp. GCM10027626 TaxID=3273411 RepID=UPI003638C9D2